MVGVAGRELIPDTVNGLGTFSLPIGIGIGTLSVSGIAGGDCTRVGVWGVSGDCAEVECEGEKGGTGWEGVDKERTLGGEAVSLEIGG